MKLKHAICIALLFGSSLASEAGVLIEYVTKNATTNKEEPLQTMWVQGGVARMESKRARGTTAMIFKDEAIHVLDDATKTYRVMDKATMEQTAAMMNDAMAKMREQMAKMPPEQRAMMEQMMKQRGGPAAGGAPAKPVTYDAQPVAGTQTIEGRTCKLWNVTRDGVLSQQLCVVPMSSMPGADEVIALMKKMSAMYEKLGEQFKDQFGETQQAGATFAKINGYPIMTRSYANGVLQPDQFIVKTWKQQTIESGKFEIPAGYKKQEMPKMKR